MDFQLFLFFIFWLQAIIHQHFFEQVIVYDLRKQTACTRKPNLINSIYWNCLFILNPIESTTMAIIELTHILLFLMLSCISCLYILEIKPKYPAQMNISSEKKIMDLEKRLVVAWWEGEGMGGIGSLGLSDTT